jgi:hypothetical protein
MTFPFENHPPRQHERNAMTDIVNRLRTNRECLAPCLMDEAADEIVRLERVVLDLTAERDEARLRLCKVVGDNRDMWGEDVAKEYGWDCFKEDGK